MKESKQEESIGTGGPATCPLDLKSCDATLPDQSCDTSGENPKMDAMMKMIDARIGTPFDETGGMKSNDTKSRAFLT